MKTFLPFAFLAANLFSTQNCTEHKESKAPLPPISPVAAISLPPGFNDYWYAGKAELSTYDVTQERYGEIRKAEQVNVFVTEDFSGVKQVKLDDPAAAGIDRIPVLKLNTIRRFHTGIYDYSIMQSVFTPVNGAPTLKTSTTVQDWCGQVFIQNNLEASGYRQRSFSYFEKEGDQDIQLPKAMLEDELWSRIRLDPWAIPSGSISILPTAIYTRLRHQAALPQKGEIQIEKGTEECLLKLRYLEIPRSLSIRFKSVFPYSILGWEEKDQDKVSSKGVLKATRRSAYWTEHDNVHAPLRDSLKLGF